MNGKPPDRTVFQEALVQERDRLNAQFALRCRAGAQLDESAALDHLRSGIGPLVEAVHTQFPERTRSVLNVLFELSLDLLAASLLGDQPRHPYVVRVWRELLPAAPRLLARDPQRVAGCLSNAIHNVATQANTRPDVWLGRMQQLAAACDSVAQLLEAGKVSAWQAGMVQYRAGALAALRQLPAAIGAVALGFTWQRSINDWLGFVDRLAEDRWRTVAAALARDGSAGGLRCVATPGAFRGYGGLFLRPPTVSCHDQQLYVSDGDAHWQLLADTFGCWFDRVTEPPAGAPRRNRSRASQLSPDGTLQSRERSARFPQLANPTSVADDGSVVAVTIATSFHIFLVAAAEQVV